MEDGTQAPWSISQPPQTGERARARQSSGRRSGGPRAQALLPARALRRGQPLAAAAVASRLTADTRSAPAGAARSPEAAATAAPVRRLCERTAALEPPGWSRGRALRLRHRSSTWLKASKNDALEPRAASRAEVGAEVLGGDVVAMLDAWGRTRRAAYVNPPSSGSIMRVSPLRRGLSSSAVRLIRSCVRCDRSRLR